MQNGLVVIGIRRGGEALARRLVTEIASISNEAPGLGFLADPGPWDYGHALAERHDEGRVQFLGALRRRIALKALENGFDLAVLSEKANEASSNLVDGEAFAALVHKPRPG